MNAHLFRLTFLCLASFTLLAAEPTAPVRYAIVGLVHDHARGFIPGAKDRRDVELVGIVEANKDLANRYAQRFNLSSNLFFADLDDLFAKTKVDGVATFTSTFGHKEVVEKCA